MAFLFKLETSAGTPAEPPTLEDRRSELEAGRRDPTGPQFASVVAVRDDDADEPPVLVVERVA